MHESRVKMLKERVVNDGDANSPQDPTLGKWKTGANVMPLGTRNRLATHESFRMIGNHTVSKNNNLEKGDPNWPKENLCPQTQNDQARRRPLQDSVTSRKRSRQSDEDHPFAPKPKTPKLGSTIWTLNPTKSVPENYICKRCGRSGHWLQLCPTNLDPTFDLPPQADYCCDICRQYGDHFVTLCPRNRVPTSLTMQRRRAQEERYSERRDVQLDNGNLLRSPREQTSRRGQGHHSRSASPRSKSSRRARKFQTRERGDCWRPCNEHDDFDSPPVRDTEFVTLPKIEAHIYQDKVKDVLHPSKGQSGMDTRKHEQNLQLGRLSFSDAVPSPSQSPTTTDHGALSHDSPEHIFKKEQVQCSRLLSCKESTGCSGGHDPVACANEQADRFLDELGLEFLAIRGSQRLPVRSKVCNV